MIIDARGVIVLIAPHRENNERDAVAQRAHYRAMSAVGDDNTGFGQDVVMRRIGKNSDIRGGLKTKPLKSFT